MPLTPNPQQLDADALNFRGGLLPTIQSKEPSEGSYVPPNNTKSRIYEELNPKSCNIRIDEVH